MSGRGWGRLWGGSSESGVPFSLMSARASGSTSFRVTFSERPQLSTPLDPGDTSRLSNWTLSRVDKTQKLTLLTVHAVEDLPTVVEFVIAERWAGKLAQYRITGDGALRSWLNARPIATPATADFYGSPAVIQSETSQDGVWDILNVQTSPDLISGGLEVGTDGDYRKENGLSLLKKVILREVFYAQGDFMHLGDTQWGVGLEAKNLYTDSDLITLRKRLEGIVAKQPEVMTSAVSITAYPDGRFMMEIRAKTQFGDLEVTKPYPGIGA